MSTSDKSLFQVRRQIATIQSDNGPQKKKIDFKKFIPHISVKNRKSALIGITIGVGILAVGGFGYYEYLQSQNPAVIYQRKLQSMTDTINTKFKLPTDEQPVVATVSDINSLPKETFFENAQEGDKILMYKKHKLAVLYRPTTGDVVTYATLEFKDIPTPVPEVAGASTSAQIATASAVIIGVTPGPTIPYVPQGKILVRPQ